MKKKYLLSIVLLVLSVVSFAVAAFYFRRAIILQDSYNQYLERLNVPFPHSPPNPDLTAEVKNSVTQWQMTGFMATFTGIFTAILTLLFYKKARVIALTALILLLATFTPRSFAVGYNPTL